MSAILWHNGNWIEAGSAIFTASDRARLGDGLFDTLLCVDGRAMNADRHFARLIKGAAVLDIMLDLGLLRFKVLIEEMLMRNDALTGRFALNTILSRGEGERGLAAPKASKPQMVLRLSPVPSEFVPVNGCVAASVRRNEGSPLSQIKSFNYGDNILALKEAERRGCNEAILINNKGYVSCASAGNIFMVKNGIISTPLLSDGAMNGIARQILLERYPAIMQRSVAQDELLEADEVFLTNSVRGACFFRSLEGKPLNQNSLGINKEFHVGS